MLRSKESVHHALKIFKELSAEAEKFNDIFPPDSKFDEWVESVKETFINFRDCNRVENVRFNLDIATLFVKSNNVKPIGEEELVDQRSHVHDNKIPASNEVDPAPSYEQKNTTTVNDLHVSKSALNKVKDSGYGSTSNASLPVREAGPNLPECASPRRSSKTSETKTPLLSDENQTPRIPVLPSIAESGTLCSSRNKSVREAGPNLPECASSKRSSKTSETKTPLFSDENQTPRIPVLASIAEPRILRSSKNKSSDASSCGTSIEPSQTIVQKSFKNAVLSICKSQKKNVVGQSVTLGPSSVLSAIPVHMSKSRVLNETFQKSPSPGLTCTDPVDKLVPAMISTPVNPNHRTAKNNAPVTFNTPVSAIRRPKRKSSVQRGGSSKRQKENLNEAPAPPRKSGNLRKKVLHKKTAKKSGSGSNSGGKSGKKHVACVAPTAPKKISEVPKEVQIMEDIKKKEAKAEENRLKILATKQLKMEEKKKKQDERRMKMMEKRLEMEKEKQQFDFQKAQAMKEMQKSAKPIRVKELADQHAKENVVKSAEKPKLNVTEVLKTPVSVKSPPSDTYDVTPLPDSSVYDSDEEVPRTRGKHIPVWAQGVNLKNALVQQYYNSVDSVEEEIFGNYIEPPDLTKIFQLQKRHYLKRTSSAIWHKPLF